MHTLLLLSMFINTDRSSLPKISVRVSNSQSSRQQFYMVASHISAYNTFNIIKCL
ncbi:hypothetical protein Ocin01_15828 [Orchesella cincta]|uniref:Uncharacterized protein n=1 Tax=Orchesella cincta TaxID=48709 RepID=A0A1D2MDB5_ORCCI|nr:hypothetical protein Ocin01_15828 [Orchesella cincta]